LLSRPGARQAEEVFVAEGAKLVEQALDAGRHVESVYLDPAGRGDAAVEHVVRTAADRGARVFELGRGVMERVADTVTPQPVCAVVGFVDRPLEDLIDRRSEGGEVGGPLLVCADVRDPGNLGAVLRTAAASGASGVVVCAGSVDPYNPKTVRASAGAVFRVGLARAPEPAATLERLHGAGWRVLGTAATSGTRYEAAELDGNIALVLGNEATGLPDSLGAVLDGVVSIPMGAGTESLNVAMAATVLCFEAARRRAAGVGGVAERAGGVPAVDA
jgi:RNA methyltransferase, TrmH family